MTYVELIVVLSIFAVFSSIVVFNYGAFQDQVDIRNLASDIASKVVESQKSSLNGLLPVQAPTIPLWKPSYGVYFNLADNQSFTYFVDLNNNTFYDNTTCTGECLNQITITKNNTISNLSVVGTGCDAINNLSVVFKRPDSKAIMTYRDITTSANLPLPCTTVSYAQITIHSPRGGDALIKLYPSGRVQVN